MVKVDLDENHIGILISLVTNQIFVCDVEIDRVNIDYNGNNPYRGYIEQLKNNIFHLKEILNRLYDPPHQEAKKLVKPEDDGYIPDKEVQDEFT